MGTLPKACRKFAAETFPPSKDGFVVRNSGVKGL